VLELEEKLRPFGWSYELLLCENGSRDRTIEIGRELEIEHPVVDFRVFKNISYAAASGLNFLIGTALFAGSFLYSLFCGTVLHYEAMDIGLLFLRGSWIQVFIMPLVGRLIGKVDTRFLIAFGTVGLVAKAWGTQVTLDLSKVHGPAECELVAVSRTGERRVVMGWLVTAPGDGVPGHPAHLVLRGGTSIPRSDLSRVDVDVVNGRTLVSIPV
jgi:hypothetical protein